MLLFCLGVTTLNVRYARLLEGLGMQELIKLQCEKELALKESLVKTVFYTNIKNATDVRAEDLLINGNVVGKDGTLVDYMEISNLRSVARVLSEIGNKEIGIEDISTIREALLKGVYSHGKYLGGFRRYRLSVGTIITPKVDEIEQGLRGLVDLINKDYGSGVMNLLNAIEFNAKFLEVHPFEDGDGRTARLLMNNYLIGRGVKPVHVSADVEQIWPECLSAYYLSRATGPYMISAIMNVIGKAGMETLADRALGLDKDDAYELSLRTLILSCTGDIDSVELKSDVEKMYRLGRGLKDREIVGSALWIGARNGFGGKIAADACKSEDPMVRAMGVYAESCLDFSRYRKSILHAAFADPEERVRMVAVAQLGNNGALGAGVLKDIIKNEESELVLLAASKFAVKTSEHKGMVDIAEALISSGKHELRVRGHILMAVHADSSYLANIIENRLGSEPEEIRKGVIIELGRCERLNDQCIAEALIKAAQEDRVMRESLLGELIVSKNVSRAYERLFDWIICRGDGDGVDGFGRAYAVYMLGEKAGYSGIEEAVGKRGRGLEGFEQFAGDLVKLRDTGSTNWPEDAIKVISRPGNDMAFACLTELGIVLRQGGMNLLNDVNSNAIVEAVRRLELRAERRGSKTDVVDLVIIARALELGIEERRRERVGVPVLGERKERIAHGVAGR